MTGPYLMVYDVAVQRDGIGIARWAATGDELGPHAGVRPHAMPVFLVVEAMAQCAGRTLEAIHPDGGIWLLAEIHDARVEVGVHWDVPVELEAKVVRTTAGLAVLDTSARQRGEDVGHARISLFRVPI